jgi:hypothetical protein
MIRVLLLMLLLVLGVWFAAMKVSSQSGQIALFALMACCGVALMLLARMLRRRAMVPEHSDPERAAKFTVTQMLGALTRLQVAYLTQGFASEAEGRAWLRQAVPRSFRGATEELLTQLERARAGERPPALSLALRVLEVREQLRRYDDVLEELSPRYPGYALARPLVFVVTENVSEDGDTDPMVVSVAGWDPSKATLLPQVDALTIYAGEGVRRSVAGQVDFRRAESAIRAHLTREEVSDDVRVLVCPGVPLAELPLPLSDIPLGFLVADAEAGIGEREGGETTSCS